MTDDKLKELILESPVIKFDNYEYFISSITDGVIAIEPGLVLSVAMEINRITKLQKCDKLVTIESMGIPITSIVSYLSYLPYIIIRKRSYSLPNEVSFTQKTGYNQTKMYINGLKKGDRIIIIDDVLSTGGTLKGLIPALKDIGIEILEVVILVNKHPNKQALEELLEVNIKTLIDIEIINGKVSLR